MTPALWQADTVFSCTAFQESLPVMCRLGLALTRCEIARPADRPSFL
jgi:hypothetical protein